MTVTTSEQDTSAAEPAAAADRRPASPLLTVEGLRTSFFTRRGTIKAVDGVGFALAPGETLAIVGESGCGKSVTALSLMRLVPDPPGRIVGGTVRLGGVDLLGLDEEAMRDVRGKDIAMIFQEPMTSLNPVLTVGSQIAEVLLLHEPLTRAQAWHKAVDMLRLVRDEDVGVAGEGHGDHRALPHSARELMRIVVVTALRIRDPHLAQEVDRPAARVLRADVEMRLDRLDDLVPDPIDRIQRGHRVLEDHRDLPPANPAELVLLEVQQVAALVVDLTLEAGIRAFDPCLSCSTHALGQMALHVQLVNSAGRVVDEAWRS